jgi:hypothetical protein
MGSELGYIPPLVRGQQSGSQEFLPDRRKSASRIGDLGVTTLKNARDPNI